LHPGQTYGARDPRADIDALPVPSRPATMVVFIGQLAPARRKFVQLRLTFAR